MLTDDDVFEIMEKCKEEIKKEWPEQKGTWPPRASGIMFVLRLIYERDDKL